MGLSFNTNLFGVLGQGILLMSLLILGKVDTPSPRKQGQDSEDICLRLSPQS